MNTFVAVVGWAGAFALGVHCANLLDEADRTYPPRYPLDPRSPSPVPRQLQPA